MILYKLPCYSICEYSESGYSKDTKTKFWISLIFSNIFFRACVFTYPSVISRHNLILKRTSKSCLATFQWQSCSTRTLLMRRRCRRKPKWRWETLGGRPSPRPDPTRSARPSRDFATTRNCLRKSFKTRWTMCAVTKVDISKSVQTGARGHEFLNYSGDQNNRNISIMNFYLFDIHMPGNSPLFRSWLENITKSLLFKLSVTQPIADFSLFVQAMAWITDHLMIKQVWIIQIPI